MTWASHPTTEMPPSSIPPAGGPRRGRGIIIGAIVAALLLGGIVVVALKSNDLLGFASSNRPVLLPARSTEPTPTEVQLSTTATTDPNNGTGAPSTATQTLEDQVVAATNDERAKVKCAALTMDDRLRTAAQVHSADMASYAYLSHTGHNGSDPVSRMKDAGYTITPAIGWAENVARGYPTVDAVMAAFMGSPDHRANILNCSMKVIGVGVARSVAGELYWTQDFATK
jgi:uncharacterized protein YkwD